MDAVMEIEPRTSMERHLMDRDREGQLYLEARRQQAAQELLANRTSFLSTITPPSTNPSSTASSIYREPNSHSASSSSSESGRAGQNTLPVYSSSLPATVMSSTTTAATNTTTTYNTTVHNFAPTPNSFLSPYPPIENSPQSKKSSRKRSASRSRTPAESNHRPLLPISPSSLEYQLAANLLSYYPTAASTTTNSASTPTLLTSETKKPRSGSRSRSKPRSQKSRRPTVSNTHIDTKISTTSSSSSKSSSKSTTGHKQSGSRDGPEIYNNNTHKDEHRSHSHTTIEELTPTSLVGSIPSSPIDIPVSSSHHAILPQSSEPQDFSPSPPLPPLPPKSPKSLIAHYFPGSLPPPPSRGRAPVGPKELIIAPTPFKTPTFGPASILSSSFQDNNAPPLPSPTIHFNYIPSANVSRCTITPIQNHDDSDIFPYNGRPSPSTSAIGFSTHEKLFHNHPSHPNHNPTTRQASDLDLFGSGSNRGRFHNQPHRNNNFNRNQPINNFSMHDHSFNNTSSSSSSNPAENPINFNSSVELMTPPNSNASNITAFTSTTSISSNNNNYNNTIINGNRGRSPIIISPASPIYPRGLMSSADPLADQINPIVLRAQQKAIPYIRDLIPGKEDSRLNTSQSQTTTPNISRDLQIVVEEATGRLRTNRTSHDPWLYYTPSYDEMPLSSARHRKESKYWVFRDQDGLIPGPFIFIFGILFPILWWIGCIYPILEHPDNVPETAQSAADTQSNYNSDNNRWLEPLFKFFKNIIPRRSPSAAMVSQEFSRRSQETDREGSTIAPPTQVNINAIPLPIQAPSLDSRGPWSAEENASSALFEQRIEYDRKVQRYNVTQRWKRIHLALSIGTFVIAIIITSFTMSFKH